MAKLMDPILPILSTWGSWAILLGSFGGQGIPKFCHTGLLKKLSVMTSASQVAAFFELLWSGPRALPCGHGHLPRISYDFLGASRVDGFQILHDSTLCCTARILILVCTWISKGAQNNGPYTAYTLYFGTLGHYFWPLSEVQVRSCRIYIIISSMAFSKGI